MINGLVNYLKTKDCITDFVDTITYKKPIEFEKLSNYLYYTYELTRSGDGYQYRLQFNLFNKDTEQLEILSSNLESIFIEGRRSIPLDLKSNFPKIWKCLLINKIPFVDESIIILDFQIYYNF